jgi:predicted DNA-binding transcriptional regulator AlpA
MTASSDSGAGDRLITADEAAAILNVSKAWVYEQTRRQRMNRPGLVGGGGY